MNVRRLMMLGLLGREQPPIVVVQPAGVQIDARAYSPIIVAQSITTSIVAEEGAGDDTPLTICGADLLQWCRADLGLTIGASFDWQDQGPGNKDYTNATAANGPSLTATDATLSNLPTLTFNGTSQGCTSPLQLPAPGTSPTFLWMIVKQNAWVSNENLVSGDGGPVIRQSNSSPNIRQFNTNLTTENPGAPLSLWRRVACWFSNSAADYLRAGSTNRTGVNAGNSADASAARHIGRNAGGTTFTSMSIAEIVYADADYLAALDAYGTARYGAGLF